MFTRNSIRACGILVFLTACLPATAGDDPVADCNENGINDAVDIAAGTSQDCQPNGTPDECEVAGEPGAAAYVAEPFLPIPNNHPAGVSTSIHVQEAGIIQDLSVLLWIDHQAQGDVRATLTHGGVTVMLVNRPGSNQGCAPPASIYGYFADDYGSDGNLLVLDDGASVGVDCYAGSLASGAVGTFNYAGPARPTHSLSEFNGLSATGAWTLNVSDHLFYNSGTLNSWGLIVTSRPIGDCNANGIPDDCDITAGSSPDENGNGVPDECEARATSAHVVGAHSRGNCDLDLGPGVRSEPRRGGLTQLRVAFNEPPTDPIPGALNLQQRTCTAPQFAPYEGPAVVDARVVGQELVLSFSPALENARTYRVSFDSSVTGLEGQVFEFRVLFGDANGDGFVNATDRSTVVGQWQGGGFSCGTDVNNDGFTTATDRSVVIGVWTGTENCAP